MESKDIIDSKATSDFDKAKGKAMLSNLANFLTATDRELLSFYDIKSIIKPRSETYRGMKVVKLDDIVGSEGRYSEFNKAFLPKREHLRGRWESIDKAYHKDVILPPIKLYKIGEAYFVRDGNHRVSVARMQGTYSIDAEVTEITTEIHITKNMGMEDVRRAVADLEKKRLMSHTDLKDVLPLNEIVFTTPGRYEEMIRHIQGHKYFKNLDHDHEMSFNEAAKSWYNSLYIPIIEVIRTHKLEPRFPGRTEADLYIWVIKHWHDLKDKYGQEYSLDDAAKGYSAKFGKGPFRQFIHKLKDAVKGVPESLHEGPS